MELMGNWYFWWGYNYKVFIHLYGWGTETLRVLLPVLDRMGSYKSFPFYFAAFLLYFVVQYMLRKARKKAVKLWAKQTVVFLIAMVMGYLAVMGLGWYLKGLFSFPRPFIVFGALVDPIVSHMGAGDAFRSFPSGHAMFAAFLVTALWPRLSVLMQAAGIGFVLLMCWFRVATGVHFPADVLYGTLLGISVTFIVRKLVYRILRVGSMKS